jgi:hypothetical protein
VILPVDEVLELTLVEALVEFFVAVWLVLFAEVFVV